MLLLPHSVGQGKLQGQVKKYNPFPDGRSGISNIAEGFMYRMGGIVVVI